MSIEDKKNSIFVEHIRKHLFEMDIEDRRPFCKICNKSLNEIVKEETSKGIWIADGNYIPEREYIDRNGKKFKMSVLK